MPYSSHRYDERYAIFMSDLIHKTDDIDNQSAYSIAQQHDPHGIRTFGIIPHPRTVTDKRCLDESGYSPSGRT